MSMVLLFWALAGGFRYFTGRGAWIGWAAFATSLVALLLGTVLGEALRHEADKDVQGIVFVFGSAAIILWLLLRWFPQLFIQGRQRAESPTLNDSSSLSRPVAATNVPPAPAQPRSPWSVLTWMFVGILSFGTLSAVGLAVAWIAPWIGSNSRTNPESIAWYSPGNPTSNQATLTVLFPAGEIPQSIRLDGQEMTLAPVPQQGNGNWSVMTEVGPHDLQVIYESAADAGQEKFYHSTINVSRGGVTSVDAVPTLRPRVLPVNPGAAPDRVDQTRQQPRLPPGTTDSIPLADAVEVSTDVENWPRYPYQIGTGVELKTQVWIDEPGLVIRLKPLDFEGKENGYEEYVASREWGIGYFKRIGVPFGQAGNLSPGRYRVLVQDLDYGWELDRRGTIVIGQGQQTIHVKRSFVGQQMIPNDYPVNFGWAGQSYQLTTAGQVSAMNRCVSLLSGESPQTVPGAKLQHRKPGELLGTSSPRAIREQLSVPRVASKVQSTGDEAGDTD